MNFTEMKKAVLAKIASPKKKPVQSAASLNFSNGGAAGTLEAVVKNEPFRVEPKAGSFDALLRTRVEKAGWTVRQHINDADFRIFELSGREVTFSMADEHGKLSEYSGILEHSGRVASAFFRLEGREQFFNANLAGVLAVKPA